MRPLHLCLSDFLSTHLPQSHPITAMHTHILWWNTLVPHRSSVSSQSTAHQLRCSRCRGCTLSRHGSRTFPLTALLLPRSTITHAESLVVLWMLVSLCPALSITMDSQTCWTSGPHALLNALCYHYAIPDAAVSNSEVGRQIYLTYELVGTYELAG